MNKAIILVLTFVAASFAQSAIQGFNPQAPESFVYGLIQGSGLYDSSNLIPECINNLEALQNTIAKLANTKDIMTNYAEIAQALVEAGDSLQECPTLVNTAYENVVNNFNQLSHNSTFREAFLVHAFGQAKNLILNGANFTESLKAGEYYNAGNALGQIYTTLFNLDVTLVKMEANETSSELEFPGSEDLISDSESAEASIAEWNKLQGLPPKPPGPNVTGIPKFLQNATELFEGFGWGIGLVTPTNDLYTCLVTSFEVYNATIKLFHDITHRAKFATIFDDIDLIWNLSTNAGNGCASGFNSYYWTFHPLIVAVIQNYTKVENNFTVELAEHPLDAALYGGEFKLEWKEGEWYDAGVAAGKLAQIGLVNYINTSAAAVEEFSATEEDLTMGDIPKPTEKSIETCNNDLDWVGQMIIRIENNINATAVNEMFSNVEYLFNEIPHAISDCYAAGQTEEFFITFGIQMVTLATTECHLGMDEALTLLKELKALGQQGDKVDLLQLSSLARLENVLLACFDH